MGLKSHDPPFRLPVKSRPIFIVILWNRQSLHESGRTTRGFDWASAFGVEWNWYHNKGVKKNLTRLIWYHLCHATVELDGKTYLPVHDHRGSIAVLVDPTANTVIESYRYNAFGEEETQIANP
jgi:hypothetical protein